MKRGVVKFEVYSCYYDGELLYVGSGAISRHKHCNSGCSHVYELNKLHFEGAVFDIKLRYFETKEESLEVEKALIREHLPKLNSVHTSRNKSKAKWFEQYNKLREVFAENNKFDDKPSLRNKVNALFDDFLKLHPLPLIDEEGVVIRGRTYYISRGYVKFEGVLKNRTKDYKYGNNVFIIFFSILKASLETVFKKPIDFVWMSKNKSFKDDLLSLEDLYK